MDKLMNSEFLMEVNGKRLSVDSRDFIDRFMKKPKNAGEFDLEDGEVDKENNPLFKVIKINDNIWSLNLATEPYETIVQIDHENKKLRLAEPVNDWAWSALYAVNSIYRFTYVKNWNKERRGVIKSVPGDYSKTGTTLPIPSGVMISKKMEKLDIKSLLRSI